ncbi:MerR family transcriptional regulator [Streptomyces wuyuanensis]|uniref:MerR family transcriptional regulator n=1 Tax=Streptomyces wuyuanensis TaxID=1196353 RepID=UPI003F541E73
MSLSEIAKETGLNRRTVRKYLSSEGPVAPPRRATPGHGRRRKVDGVAPLIDAMLRSEILIKGAVVHERLVAEYGFTGTYQRVKLYMQEARPRIAEEPARHRRVPQGPAGGGEDALRELQPSNATVRQRR